MDNNQTMQGNTLITCDRCGWSSPEQKWQWTPSGALEQWERVGGVEADAPEDVFSFTGREYLCPTCKPSANIKEA